MKEEVYKLASVIAPHYSLDPFLVLAITEQESGYSQFALRLEQGYYFKYLRKNANIPQVVKPLMATSWGLMQVMGLSFFEMNEFKHFTKPQEYVAFFDSYLADPAFQIHAGCRWFLKKMTLAGDEIRKALLYWNGGGNPAYPDEVLARRERLKVEFTI